MIPNRTALLTIDLQNDFLHPEGAYGRAGQSADAIAALPDRIAPVREALIAAGGYYISAQFTLVPGRGGEPLIAPHLRELRPFLTKGDLLGVLSNPSGICFTGNGYRYADHRRHRDQRWCCQHRARRPFAQHPHYPAVGRLRRVQARGPRCNSGLARVGQ